MNTPEFDTNQATSIYLMRRERDLRPFFLEQVEGTGAPRRIPLCTKEAVIGRSEQADICVQSQRASRLHAVFTRNGTDCTIRDNNSHNGVLLNGIRIHSATLREGDVIQIADTAFIFHEG